MVRAHSEMPKRKEQKDLTPLFDLSDSPVREMPKADPESKPPVPVEAKRPRRAKRPSKELISSETPNAAVAGEIDAEIPISDEDIIELQDEKPAFPAGMKGSEMPLSFEVRDLGNAFEAAKADFEAVAEEIDRRVREIGQELADRHLPAETLMVWTEAIQQREGLSQKLDAAMDKMIEARKAYVEAYEKWEKQLAENEQGKKEMEQAIDQLIAENPPQAPQETAEEMMWYDRGDKTWKETDQIAEVRKEIAGNELEEPIGTPADLAMLGFDQVFIDAYKETQDRLEKAEAQKAKAGFFKKLFGGAKIERDYESARSDFESMQEDVMRRRTARERQLRESGMTPAQIEAQRKSDAAKLDRIVGRGRLP